MSNINLDARQIEMELLAQDRQLSSILSAERAFESTGDIGELIAFWENLWSNGGLLFRGAKWSFRLTDLYMKVGDYKAAKKAVRQIKDRAYSDKKKAYIQKIDKLILKNKKEKRDG